MKRLKIGFVMDDLTQLVVATDTSCFLMKSALERGHEVFYICDKDVFVENAEPMAYVFVPRLVMSDDGVVIQIELGDERLCFLNEFDVLINRKDPPFDMNYIFLSYILELVRDKVFFVNDPQGVRSANEKFYALNFPQFIPDTMVTRREADVKRFLRDHESNGIVLKPLDGKGGEGVFKLAFDDLNKNELIKMMVDGGKRFVMAQEFLSEIRDGDKRIVVIGGEPVNAFLRIPKDDDFRGNICAGATLVRSDVTARECEMVAKLKPFLIENGLWLVGLDVIGERITEINVTSPIIGFTLFPENGMKVLEFIESKL